MKALLIIGGVVVVTIAGWVGYMKSQAGKMAAESAAYVQAQLPAIIGHWDFETLKAQASPEFMDAHPKEQLESWLAYNAKLGAVRDAGETHGRIVKFRSTLMGGPWTGLYSEDVKFEHGEESVTLAVQKFDGVWKIAGMSVAPKDDPAAASSPSAAPKF